MTLNKKTKLTLSLLGFILLQARFLAYPAALDSANLTSVKDTLQTSRLSWGARVEADGTAEGSSIVQIQAAPAAPLNSTSTANLHAGDTVYINNNSYTVVDIIDDDEFSVNPVVQAGDADDGDPIYMEVSPQHVITFDTASAVSNGYFKILIPADSTTPADDTLDDEGFDFTSGSIDVAATDTGNYDFITGVATASGGTGCTSPANYHCFEVHYSGTGGIGTSITMTIGNTNGTNTPIAPGESPTHTEGTADTYTFYVQNYNSNDSLIDETKGAIGLIEAVRVSATVEPTISFTIGGVGTGTTTCGATPDIDTSTGTNSPLAVPFGSLSLNTFKDAAHQLTVSTNASGGYSVTAIEDDELGKDGAASPYIADTPGDNASATHTTEDEWSTASTNGFGFSIANNDAASVPFEYNTATGTCTGTFCARQFANNADTESPAEIMSSTAVADNQDIYACYRISVGATQEAGDYENIVTYTATATF